MNQILNEYRIFLKTVLDDLSIERSNGTISGMIAKLGRLGDVSKEYNSKATNRANEILDTAPEGIDKNALKDELIRIGVEMHGDLVAKF